jgi:hypothetical protein
VQCATVAPRIRLLLVLLVLLVRAGKAVPAVLLL